MVENALFYKDNYLKEFDSKVAELIEDKGKYKVVLENTAFYPEGGGQPSDIGFLNDVKVSFVEEKSGIIYHHVDKRIEVGETVHGTIDFKNRFSNMQSHSAEHIVSGIICKKYDASNVGFHIGKDFVTMDFNKPIKHEDIIEIERMANEAVYKNIDIVIKIYSNQEAKNLEYRSKIELNEDVRIVEIPGYDRCACCGVHVNKTGEIGIIKLLKIENYKSGVRIYMLAGYNAVQDYTEKHSQLDKISTMLSMPIEKVYDGVTSLKDDYESLLIENSKLKMKLFEKDIESINNEDYVIAVNDEYNPQDMKKYCEYILKNKNTQIAGVITNNKFILMSEHEDLKEVMSHLKEKMDIKGGGNSQLVQGQFTGASSDFINIIKEKE